LLGLGGSSNSEGPKLNENKWIMIDVNICILNKFFTFKFINFFKIYFIIKIKISSF
jgi:hypothetical protein